MSTSLIEKMYEIYTKQGLIQGVTKEDWVAKETARQSKLKQEVKNSGFTY